MINNPQKLLNVVVLISGNGSNLQAIIDATLNHRLDIHLCGVISNCQEAYGLLRAQRAGIKHFVIAHQQFPNRNAFERALAKQIQALHADLIVLAGFMRILGNDFVAQFEGKIINIHPSLLPQYKGLETHQRALAAHDTEHGASVHFVTQNLDDGPIIAQYKVPILSTDTVESLKARVQDAEHQLYPTVIHWFAQEKFNFDGKNYYFEGKKITNQEPAVMLPTSQN